MESILKQNTEMQKENEYFKDSNHDLRYELQEANIKLENIEDQSKSLNDTVEAPNEKLIDKYEEKLTKMQLE